MRPQALDAGAPAWCYGAFAAFIIADLILFGIAVSSVARWVL